MNPAIRAILGLAAVALLASESPSVAAFQAPAPPAAGQGKLIVFGDVTLFVGKPGQPGNCALQSRFKRGDPVGFRMTAIDPVTGQREPSAQIVVHLTYGGMTQDLPMRYRGTVKQPEREFWVAKWVVPETPPTSITRYDMTSTDRCCRTCEFKLIVIEDTQVTIVEKAF